MNRPGVRRAHAAAGSVAFLTILTFWSSTVVVELAGSAEQIVSVKQIIPWGLIVLVPALVVAGGSGSLLARGRSGRILDRKTARMRATAAIGVLVLVPCVLFLGLTASPDDLGASFTTVQAVELVAGAVNITLLGLNIRDGVRLSGRWRRGRRRPSDRPAA